MIVAQFLRPLVLLAATAADAEELASIREKLDGYLTRIEAVHINYVERWKPGEKFAEAEEQYLKRELPQDLPPEAMRGVLEGRKKLTERGSPVSVSTHDLLDAYPSFRHLWEVESTYKDGGVDRTHHEHYVQDGRLTSVNRKFKQVSSSDVGKEALLQRTPLNAIGYRRPMTLNMRVTELLQFPEVTTILGKEEIAGVSALHIKVGPELPQSVRNHPQANEHTFCELWLDPARSFLPMQIDEYFENQYEGKRGFGDDAGVVMHRVTGNDGEEREFLRYRMGVQEFMQARDLARNESLLFPKRSSFEDGGGTVLWEVTLAEINPPVTRNDFQPTVPRDYLVIVDREVRMPTMKGGTEGRQQRFDEDARKAREAIAASVPSKPSGSGEYSVWRFALPVALALVIVSLVALKFRSG